MSPRALPFTKAQRRKGLNCGYGYRDTNAWCEGDLPAPYAEGDIVHVPPDAFMLHGDPTDVLESPRWERSGFAVVTYCPSIDEGDAWYVRLHDPETPMSGSGRLHVAYADRSESGWDTDVNWMAGVELVDTADPDGLALRERMLAAGWGPPAEVFNVSVDRRRLAALEAVAEAARVNRAARDGWGRQPASLNTKRLSDSQRAIDAALEALDAAAGLPEGEQQ